MAFIPDTGEPIQFDDLWQEFYVWKVSKSNELMAAPALIYIV